MKRVPPKEIASGYFKRFVIVWLGLILAAFALQPYYITNSSGSFEVRIDHSRKTCSDVAAFLKASGFRGEATPGMSRRTNEFTGRHGGSFPFAVCVSRPATNGPTDLMLISVRYDFSGFKWNVDDSEKKVDGFKRSLDAWLLAAARPSRPGSTSLRERSV